MRVQNLSVLALAVVAGLSLTACQGDGTSDAAGGTSAPTASSTPGSGSSTSGSEGSGGQGSGSSGASAGTSGGTPQTGTGTGGSGTGTGACQTSQLAFSTSGAMAEGELIVNLKNTGSAPCTLKGFPGVDLKSEYGTVHATRSDRTPPKVSVQPGESTHFTLYFTPNRSGGSGVTFTSLVVTPPDETHSHTLHTGINVPASDGDDVIKVDPVGTGK